MKERITVIDIGDRHPILDVPLLYAAHLPTIGTEASGSASTPVPTPCTAHHWDIGPPPEYWARCRNCPATKTLPPDYSGKRWVVSPAHRARAAEASRQHRAKTHPHEH